MYTATITGKEINLERKQFIVLATISNGVKTINEKFIFNLGVVKSNIALEISRYIKRLEETDALVNDVTDGPVTLVETEPTTADLERGQWFNNYHRLVSVQKLIDLGVLTGNETPVVNLLNKVKTDFKPAYINDF